MLLSLEYLTERSRSWLQNGVYRPFNKSDYQLLKDGKARL